MSTDEGVGIEHEGMRLCRVVRLIPAGVQRLGVRWYIGAIGCSPPQRFYHDTEAQTHH